MPYFVILLLLLLLVQSVGRASNKSDFQDYYNASKLFYEQKDLYNLESIQTLKEEIKLEDLFKLENLKKLESLKGNVGTYIYLSQASGLSLVLSFHNSKWSSASPFSSAEMLPMLCWPFNLLPCLTDTELRLE